MASIPTVDFSKLQDFKTGTPQCSTKTQVLQGLREFGCFEAIYDDFPAETRQAIFDTSKLLFDFPLETKLKNITKKPLYGYQGQFPHIPLYESLCITDSLNPQSVEAFARIFWPDDQNFNFCNVVKCYSKPLVILDEILKRMVLESLGLENYIDGFLDPTFFLLRFTRYKPAGAENGDKLGLGGHTDGTYMTIISQNQINGLQILKKNGEWVDVNMSPKSFFVIAGDSFMAWTNARLHAPVHRVTIAAGDNDRFSIQLFSLPKAGYTVKAPKELIDEEHPLLFKPYDIAGYVEYANTEAGQSASGDRLFKAFCGV